MSRLLPTVLVATTLVLSPVGSPHPAMADTCVAGSSCRQPPLQFVPGQRITIEIANLTQGMVQLQYVSGTDPVPISPGQVLTFARAGSTIDPNVSLVFWDEIGLPLRVNLLKPEARTLRIEVRPGWRPPGDRSIYLQDDGRVRIL